MNVTIDTNVLVRAGIRDDLNQTKAAQALLTQAQLVIITIPTLCEFAWVMRRSYKQSAAKVAQAIRALIGSENVVTDRAVVEAGLAMLDAGGDFADGVIAFEGAALGGDTFVSFDKKAVKALHNQGRAARLL